MPRPVIASNVNPPVSKVKPAASKVNQVSSLIAAWNLSEVNQKHAIELARKNSGALKYANDGHDVSQHERWLNAQQVNADAVFAASFADDGYH